MLKVGFDPVTYDYFAEEGVAFESNLHMLVESDFVRSLSREFRQPNLFLYFHRWKGTFVLANWIYRPNIGNGPGLFTELESWNWKPDWGYPVQERDFWKKRLRPVDEIMVEGAKKIRDRVRAEKRQRVAVQEEQKRVGKWMKRQGHGLNAQLMEDCAVPWDPTPSDGNELRV